jgi:AMMECR1 domain-containing protein
MQAALEDYRFSPVTPADLSALEVEISVLGEPQPLAYDKP